MDEGSTMIISLAKVTNYSSLKILNKTPNLTCFPVWICQMPKDQPGAMLCSVSSTKRSEKEHLIQHFFSFEWGQPFLSNSIFLPLYIIQIR